MKRFRDVTAGLLAFTLAVTLSTPLSSLAALEQTFDMLQIGAQTYRNVTVTTKSKTYVFILHSAGMTNVKVADLPKEVLTKLGYEDPAAPKAETNAAKAWAKQTFSKLQSPAIKGLEDQIKTQFNSDDLRAKLPFALPPITNTFLLVCAGILLAVYLFHCFCFKLICQKTGNSPGLLVWIPILQLFPLLKAAGMSPWWFLAYLIPGLNLIAHVIWSFKIADARNKSALVGLLLLLPIVSLLAFLFLAFSNGDPPRKRERSRPVEIMTLETA